MNKARMYIEIAEQLLRLGVVPDLDENNTEAVLELALSIYRMRHKK